MEDLLATVLSSPPLNAARRLAFDARGDYGLGNVEVFYMASAAPRRAVVLNELTMNSRLREREETSEGEKAPGRISQHLRVVFLAQDARRAGKIHFSAR